MTTTKKDSSPATDVARSVTPIQDVLTVKSMEQMENTLALMERKATDLVASDVVREGYLAHGHPAALGFQHLATMTTSRLRKKFPLFDKTEPLFHILWVKGRLIVAEELVKKYEARKQGKTYDYAKSIDRKFENMFKQLGAYADHLAVLKYEER